MCLTGTLGDRIACFVGITFLSVLHYPSNGPSSPVHLQSCHYCGGCCTESHLSKTMSSSRVVTTSETSLKIPITAPCNGSRLPYRSTCFVRRRRITPHQRCLSTLRASSFSQWEVHSHTTTPISPRRLFCWDWRMCRDTTARYFFKQSTTICSPRQERECPLLNLGATARRPSGPSN